VEELSYNLSISVLGEISRNWFIVSKVFIRTGLRGSGKEIVKIAEQPAL